MGGLETLRDNGWRRILIVLSLPVLLLGVDFFLFPILLFNKIERNGVDLTTLLTERVLPLGTINGHRIFISIDDIQEPDFVSYLPKKARAALIISAYLEDDAQQIQGALQNSVLQRIGSTSPVDSNLIGRQLAALRKFQAGQVANIPLPSRLRDAFPIDNLLVIMMPPQDPDQKDVETGLTRALTIAQRTGLSNVIIPSIGNRWNVQHQNSFPIAELAEAIFGAVAQVENIDNIYIAFYKPWPTIHLESAAEALNAAWQQVMLTANADPMPLYRKDFRMTLAFMLVAFLAGAFWVKLTPANVLSIGVLFYGASLGVKPIVEFIKPDDPLTKFIISSGILLVSAVALPVVTRWSPKDIFKRDTAGDPGAQKPGAQGGPSP